MSEFIQVGVTAMRDPATGAFLESVPLYIRAEDQDKVSMARPIMDMDALAKALGKKFKQYKEEDRRIRKAALKEGGVL